MIKEVTDWPPTPDWVKNAGKGLVDFMNAVPMALRATTCRCSGKDFVGWYYNEDRKMWVCGTCIKPSAAHQGYNIICMWCENWFTIQDFPVHQSEGVDAIREAYKRIRQESCRDCGGTNDARILDESLF